MLVEREKQVEVIRGWRAIQHNGAPYVGVLRPQPDGLILADNLIDGHVNILVSIASLHLALEGHPLNVRKIQQIYVVLPASLSRISEMEGRAMSSHNHTEQFRPASAIALDLNPVTKRESAPIPRRINSLRDDIAIGAKP